MKPVNLTEGRQFSTAHAQAAEVAMHSLPPDAQEIYRNSQSNALALAAEQEAHANTQAALTSTNEALDAAKATIDQLTADLASEKEAHAITQAALTAATETKPAA
jgi:hypothetical protein